MKVFFATSVFNKRGSLINLIFFLLALQLFVVSNAPSFNVKDYLKHRKQEHQQAAASRFEREEPPLFTPPSNSKRRSSADFSRSYPRGVGSRRSQSFRSTFNSSSYRSAHEHPSSNSWTGAGHTGANTGTGTGFSSGRRRTRSGYWGNGSTIDEEEIKPRRKTYEAEPGEPDPFETTEQRCEKKFADVIIRSFARVLHFWRIDVEDSQAKFDMDCIVRMHKNGRWFNQEAIWSAMQSITSQLVSKGPDAVSEVIEESIMRLRYFGYKNEDERKEAELIGVIASSWLYCASKRSGNEQQVALAFDVLDRIKEIKAEMEVFTRAHRTTNQTLKISYESVVLEKFDEILEGEANKKGAGRSIKYGVLQSLRLCLPQVYKPPTVITDAKEVDLRDEITDYWLTS